MAPRKQKKHHGRKKMPYTKTKKYKKALKGPVHQNVIKYQGKSALNKDGTIPTGVLRKEKTRAKKVYNRKPTKTNLRNYRRATEALNFRSA